MPEKSDYERQREERIARNQEQLRSLNVPSLQPEPSKVMSASREVLLHISVKFQKNARFCQRPSQRKRLPAARSVHHSSTLSLSGELRTIT